LMVFIHGDTTPLPAGSWPTHRSTSAFTDSHALQIPLLGGREKTLCSLAAHSQAAATQPRSCRASARSRDQSRTTLHDFDENLLIPCEATAIGGSSPCSCHSRRWRRRCRCRGHCNRCSSAHGQRRIHSHACRDHLQRNSRQREEEIKWTCPQIPNPSDCEWSHRRDVPKPPRRDSRSFENECTRP
jgi:hypothetical protein